MNSGRLDRAKVVESVDPAQKVLADAAGQMKETLSSLSANLTKDPGNGSANTDQQGIVPVLSVQIDVLRQSVQAVERVVEQMATPKRYVFRFLRDTEGRITQAEARQEATVTLSDMEA